MKKSFAVLCCLLGLGACVSPRPETSFYTLVPPASVDRVSDTRAVIDIERVRIPEYMDRTQMVTTSGVNVFVSDQNRWAEGLAPMIQRSLITDIGMYLPNASVKNGTLVGASGDYTLSVEVYKLDGALAGDIEMAALYAISDAGTAVKTRNVTYTTPVGDNYGDYAVQISAMVNRLARQIATDIAALAH